MVQGLGVFGVHPKAPKRVLGFLGVDLGLGFKEGFGLGGWGLGPHSKGPGALGQKVSELQCPDPREDLESRSPIWGPLLLLGAGWISVTLSWGLQSEPQTEEAVSP